MKLDYKLLHALSVVIKDQSFERAAESLCITQSAVSQRIKQLEQYFAEPVLIRRHPIVATELGKKLLRHYHQVSQLEQELFNELYPQQQQLQTLHIATNADSLATWLIPAIAPLLKQHMIEVNMLVANEGHTLDRLKDGEAFGAISRQKKAAAGCIATLLGSQHYILVATQAFADKYFAQGINTNTLRNAPAVAFDQKDNMHVDYLVEHFGLKEGDYPLHAVRSSEAFVNMAKHGVAYCLIPELQISQELRNGQLINLLPDKPLVEVLYWHHWILIKGIHKKVSDAIINYGQQVLS